MRFILDFYLEYAKSQSGPEDNNLTENETKMAYSLWEHQRDWTIKTSRIQLQDHEIMDL